MDYKEKKKFHTQLLDLKVRIYLAQRAGEDITDLKKEYDELKYYLGRVRFEERKAKEQEAENKKGRLK